MYTVESKGSYVCERDTIMDALNIIVKHIELDMRHNVEPDYIIRSSNGESYRFSKEENDNDDER